MQGGTRGAGIFYNLWKSPYRVVTDSFVTYVFSSKKHAEKFEERIAKERERISISLSNRFDLDVSFNDIADMTLYRAIEKRGFLIAYDGEWYTCPKSIKFVGEIRTLNNLLKR